MDRFPRIRLLLVLCSVVALTAAGSAVAAPQQAGQETRAEQEESLVSERGYAVPPAEIAELFERDTNSTTLNDLSPDGDHFLVPLSDSKSTLELMSRETYRLGGLEFRPQTNRSWRQDTYGAYGLRIFSLSSRGYTDVAVPDDSFVSDTVWSPDGSRLAFVAHLPTHSEVWVADVATGESRSLSSMPVNAVLATRGFRGGGNLIQWTPRGTVVSLLVPPDRGPEPEDDRVPDGPVIRATRGKETVTRTIPFLLEDPHDADLFEHYTTSVLAELGQEMEPRIIGDPGMYSSVSVSPDGDYLMTTRVERPFSFIDSWRSFPQKTEVLDAQGNVLATLIDRPLREGGGFGRDNGGNEPRELAWRPDGEGLTFLQREPRASDDQEDADDQDPDGEQAPEEEEEDEPRLDRVMLLAPPFDMEQAQVVVESEERLSSHVFTEDGGHLFAGVSKDGERALAHWDLGAAEPARDLIVDYQDGDDLLERPGDLMTESTPNGVRYALISSDESRVYLEGPGYAEDFRPTPFIDAVTLADQSVERVFEGSKESWDRPLVALDADLEQMIVSREAEQDFPDSFLWSRDGGYEQVTENVDPFPEITAAERIHFVYERRDGVEVRGRVSLPLDYVEGEKVPAVFWTYPREYDSVEDYEESNLRGLNLNRHPRLSFRSNSEVWLTQGYALVVPDIPIIGDPYNDKYVQHLVDGMYGAIREVDNLGFIDVDRLGHGGHSYGAFATANVLARSPFFKAGIAGDGAYNRSLTPTGFQRERRDVWEAPHIYIEMSPFFVADQIDTPLLMYHGADDDNTGTWPIQSDRMIHALTALGKTAVLYKYPYESHAPRAIEHQLDLWARWLEWFDRYVKETGEEETLTESQGPSARR